MRPLHALESLWLDVVYAARSFRTQIGMAATIVLVLGGGDRSQHDAVYRTRGYRVASLARHQQSQ